MQKIFYFEKREHEFLFIVRYKNDQGSKFNCLSRGVIYKISCVGCDEYYIGQTVFVRQRVYKHKYDVLNDDYRNTKLHKHVFECAGANQRPFNIIPFYKVKDPSTVRLSATEDFFIRKFKPTLNTRKVKVPFVSLSEYMAQK